MQKTLIDGALKSKIQGKNLENTKSVEHITVIFHLERHSAKKVSIDDAVWCKTYSVKGNN